MTFGESRGVEKELGIGAIGSSSSTTHMRFVIHSSSVYTLLTCTLCVPPTQDFTETRVRSAQGSSQGGRPGRGFSRPENAKPSLKKYRPKVRRGTVSLCVWLAMLMAVPITSSSP